MEKAGRCARSFKLTHYPDPQFGHPFGGGQKNPRRLRLAQGREFLRVHERGDLTARRRDCAPGLGGCQRGLARFPPPQLVQTDRVFKATQLGLAEVSEHEPFPCSQLSDDDGSENLTRLSL